MKDLQTLETPDWSLIISGGDISKKQAQLKKILSDRHSDSSVSNILRFAQPIHVLSGVPVEGVSDRSQTWALSDTLFFENTLYDFEFCFSPDIQSEPAPEIRHNLQTVNDAFQCHQRRGLILRGTIQTRNNVGWFRLPFRYYKNGQCCDQAISFEVFPTKMDMQHDLAQIQKAIDAEYPLWRFSLAQQTEQTFDQTRQPHQPFPLLWLAQFKSLRKELLRNIQLIIQSPHSRLLPYQQQLKAERIKGKLSNRLENHIYTDFSATQYDRRYEINRRRLSINTPENQFIKMTLVYCSRQLERFYQLTQKLDQKNEHHRLSSAFFDELKTWKAETDRQLRHPLFKEIGEFHGLTDGSLVLQQRTGYAAVYRIWQQLKLYLDVLGRQASISVKTVAELYEIWCFLEIRRILKDELKFKETTSFRKTLVKSGAEMKMQDGMRSSFCFRREDNTQIRLAHEPLFRTKSLPVRGWLTTQKPDIVLEIIFPDRQKLMWVFDAKYRMDNDSSEDIVPDDALNQMHRYRDAIIHMRLKAHEHPEKTRPVFGAFALYPGYFPDQKTDNPQKNPYFSAIHDVGIGAFPLLPGEHGSAWLQSFLTEKLAVTTLNYSKATSDKYFVEEAVRIPYRGMQQLRYNDLTLIASGAEDMRTEGYYIQFINGSARYFHMQLAASEDQDIAENIMREIRYCVIASRTDSDPERTAKWLWPVENTEICKRNELHADITGKAAQPDDSRLYWLFSLGNPIPLSQKITGFTKDQHCMKLTRLTDTNRATDFCEIPSVYPFSQLVPA